MSRPLFSCPLLIRLLLVLGTLVSPFIAAASYGNLEGDWEFVDGYALENSWESDEIVRRTRKVDATVKRINDKGFYEMTATFKFDDPVMHDGEMTKKFDTTWRMVETPKLRRLQNVGGDQSQGSGQDNVLGFQWRKEDEVHLP